MKKIISIILVVACMLFFLAACGSQTHNPEPIRIIQTIGRYPYYESIEDLASVATYVIRAEVLDERVERLDILIPSEKGGPYDAGGDLEYFYELFMIYRLKVLEIFQGDVSAGDIMEVRLLKRQLGDEQLISLDHYYFTVGDDLVLFLRAPILEHLAPSLPNPFQSAYRFPAQGDSIMALSADQELESVHPDGGLTLTIQDLIQISEGTLRNP